jgi:hypothetical protein
VLRQFAAQYLRDPTSVDPLLLVTTPDASSKITADLRKLTRARRLNLSGADRNPASKRERGVLDLAKAHLRSHLSEFTGAAATDDAVQAVLRRMIVLPLDIEDGSNLERAVLVAIGTQAQTAPDLIWSALVARGIELASQRLSVGAEELTALYGRHFTRGQEVVSGARDELLSVVMRGRVAAGYDVVLVRHGAELRLLALPRFTPGGERVAEFAGQLLRLRDKTELELVRRTSTWQGMTRLLIKQPGIAEDREVVIVDTSFDIDAAEATPFAQAHAELLDRYASENAAPLRCLLCGRPVSDSEAHMAEIDEVGHDPAVGLVHSTCLRPAVRVLGTISSALFEQVPELVDFDYRTWLRRLPRGQAVLGTTEALRLAGVVTVAWNRTRRGSPNGAWCVAYAAEDGAVRYVSERGCVIRASRQDADVLAAEMRTALAHSAKQNDPICILDHGASYTFGSYSTLIPQARGGNLHRVTSAEVRRVTRAIVDAHDVAESWYAPLLVLRDGESGAILGVAGMVVLVSDPLELGSQLANWQTGGVELPPYTTQILDTDDAVDLFFSQVFADGVGIVLDPVLDGNGNLVGGSKIVDERRIRMEAERRKAT